MHLDTVIGYRQKFLQEFGRKETDKTFLQHLSEVTDIFFTFGRNYRILEFANEGIALKLNFPL